MSVEVSFIQTLVSPSGSGKSTILDVVGFLEDLLRVGSLKPIPGEEIARVRRMDRFTA